LGREATRMELSVGGESCKDEPDLKKEVAAWGGHKVSPFMVREVKIHPLQEKRFREAGRSVIGQGRRGVAAEGSSLKEGKEDLPDLENTQQQKRERKKRREREKIRRDYEQQSNSEPQSDYPTVKEYSSNPQRGQSVRECEMTEWVTTLT